MFTVIIAEKEHIDKIHEYELFLRPFLTAGDVVFCQWNPREARLADMVPDLADKVGRRREWRAVILCNEDGLHQQNPFDLVKTRPRRFEGAIRGTARDAQQSVAVSQENMPEDDIEIYARIVHNERDLDNIYSEEYKKFLEEEHERKLQAYEEAAGNPLTRLVTFFCDTPTVTKGLESQMNDGDPDFRRYIVEHQRKEALRRQILDGEQMDIFQPTEVLCLAKRTYTSAQKEFDTVWSSHTEMEYTRFYDRNMYFDKMRYLVFDILPKNQRDYMFNYIRFLYAAILLASQHVPSGCLAAERVYTLQCENDEDALSALLQTYEAKLKLTKEYLNQEIQKIREKKPRVLSDREVKAVFEIQTNQAVLPDGDFSQEELTVRTVQFGLADGCRHDEAILWDREYKRTQEALGKLLKQSRRGLKKSAKNARSLDDVSYERMECLNEFQVEDIQEYTDNQEMEMLGTQTMDLYNEEPFREDMEQAHKKVHRKIRTRMYRGTTLALGAVACLMFILGFFTVFFRNSGSGAFSLVTALIVVGVALGVFAVSAVVVLFFLRWGLVKEVRDFNESMAQLGHRVFDATAQYSKYLNHMTNVRRGYGVLDAVANREDPDHDRIVLYKKHILDIETALAEVRMVFGQFMVGSEHARTDQLKPYDHNFNIPMDYAYPLPYHPGTARRITFVQKGVFADVPVEFVKSLMVRREELYE